MNVDELVEERRLEDGNRAVYLGGRFLFADERPCSLAINLRTALRDILPRWVPVGERVPEGRTLTLVLYDTDDGPELAAAIFDHGAWSGLGAYWDGSPHVTHWLDGVPEVPE